MQHTPNSAETVDFYGQAPRCFQKNLSTKNYELWNILLALFPSLFPFFYNVALTLANKGFTAKIRAVRLFAE
jgi:hypothetical protein